MHMTNELKKCPWCDSLPPHSECFGRATHNESASCARMVMYETAKLPASWRDACKKFDDGHITTNADIQAAMQAEIDSLRVYASRLAVNLMLLNNIITRAARDAQKYVDAAEGSIGHD